MTETIGFIGLGSLGSPMAANLLDAGYALRVHNRTASKADGLVALGAVFAERPADAVTAGGVVVTLLWDDASVEEVVASDGFLDRLGPGGVHVSVSTISPEASKRLAAIHARHGSVLVEAPVFGRPDAAVARMLWIPFAGPPAAKQRVRPLLTAMGAREVFDFGEEIGAATTVKLVGNFLLISAARSLVEGLTMVDKSGFDARATIDMLTQTLFPSPIYQAYGRMVAAKSPTLGQSGIPLKDVGLFMKTAREAGSPAPISGLLLDLLRDGA
jgi:3-hydroxyisobutyrate dehydrogenase-like beta-hydroxyacid dehydrogenase